LEPPTVQELKQKASALFFPDGESAFADPIDDMLLAICDTTQTAIIEFPGDGTVESYLKDNGLYPSTTYLFDPNITMRYFQNLKMNLEISDSQAV